MRAVVVFEHSASVYIGRNIVIYLPTTLAKKMSDQIKDVSIGLATVEKRTKLARGMVSKVLSGYS